WLYYECACVNSMLHESSSALDFLRLSFEIQPRWQPYARNDVRLSYLNAQYPFEVARICASPLVGTWVGADRLSLDFSAVGTRPQRVGNVVKQGRYSRVGAGIRAFKAEDGSNSYAYRLTATQLAWNGSGKSYELSRTASPLWGT